MALAIKLLLTSWEMENKRQVVLSLSALNFFSFLLFNEANWRSLSDQFRELEEKRMARITRSWRNERIYISKKF